MSAEVAVRLGIVGLGNIGRQHIDNITGGRVKGCTLAAVSSRQTGELDDKPGVAHFTDYRDMIASELCDAVLVATPTFNHAEIGACVLQAGLHLMMEKPIGLSVQEGQGLIGLQQPGQVFALMLNQRTDPLFLAMRECISQGKLGEILRTHWTMTNWFRPEVYFQVSDWRATWRGEGGGLLVNQCIHNLDIFQWLCGMPSSVKAFCRFGRYHNIEVEDEATAYFEYDNGASGVFIGSTGEAPGVNRFDIVGDKGSLSFDGEKLVLTENAPATSEYSRETRDMFGMPATAATDITPDRSGNQHASVMSNFVAAIRGGAPLIAPAEEGLDSLALANAMLLSTWEDRVVDLPLDPAAYQAALEQRLANSSLRQKADIEANVDMNASYR
jgi:predicted dehydrogenase